VVPRAIAAQRLRQQRLTQNPLPTADAVVDWLGAVQAQDYAGAMWALGLRMQQATAAHIEQAFHAGTILRTHVLRPTWHFVLPRDIRWMLDLTAPRIRQRMAPNDRHLELDAALIARSTDVLASALAGSRYLTRAELGAVLADAGIAAAGSRLAHLLMHAELDGIVCSGPRRGTQFTYALLAERAPQAHALPRDMALATLTRRYYTGHGPATIHDFAWWSGLTIADAKDGLALGGSALTSEDLDGQRYYWAAARPPAAEPTSTAFLLPTYDEWLVGYRGFDQARRGGPAASGPLVYESPLVLDGTVIGSWRRIIAGDQVTIEVAPFRIPGSAEADAIAAAAQRYATFVGRAVHLVERQPTAAS
jgi:hypothetical protein